MYYFFIAFIIAACLAFLILHQRLARRLQRVETSFSQLEDALRERLDLIAEFISSLPEPSDNQLALCELCEASRDGETDELLRAWVKIDKRAPVPKTEEERGRFEENETKIRELGRAYNNALEPYNAMLDKFPWKLYAPLLMIEKEERFYV